MMKNCDKYIKKGKYGLMLFSTVIIIGILKKTKVIDNIGDTLDIFLIMWIVIATTISIILFMPYINCLSKYKKR